MTTDSPASVKPERVLVYRIGSLGDTLVAVPALWRIRAAFPTAQIRLLCDRHANGNTVLASDLLRDSGVVDEFVHYTAGRADRARRVWRLSSLWLRLATDRYAAVVYLAPAERPPAAVRRDRAFFRSVGVRRLIGFGAYDPLPRTHPLPPTEPEWRLLDRRLDGELPPRPPRFDIGLGPADLRAVDDWRHRLPPDGGRRWVAVAPGSKMPAKVWPAERYRAVVGDLIRQADVWPVVFGDHTDRPSGERLIRDWGRGYCAAGELGLRASIAGIRRAALYLGNDTGTMHMAASEGVPCVAVFCSHSEPGRWYPAGDGHRVFRTLIDCEGCRLEVCTERRMACILATRPDEVTAACLEVLRR